MGGSSQWRLCRSKPAGEEPLSSRSSCPVPALLPHPLPPFFSSLHHRRISIKTAVTQSKTASLNSPSSVRRLPALPWFYWSITAKKRVKNVPVEEQSGGPATCTLLSDISADKSLTLRLHVSQRNNALSLSCSGFLRRSGECPTAPSEQLSGQQDRRLSWKRQDRIKLSRREWMRCWELLKFPLK